MAIITDIVLQCKGIFSWHIHLGSGWLQSACALADEEHKWTAYPELNLKIWQHNLRAGLAALAVHCQTSIMWRPCTSAPRRMQCLSFFLVAFSYLLSSEVGSCIQCSVTVDPLYWPVGTNAKPCDKRSEMALFCGTRRAHKALSWQPCTEAFGWNKGPVDNVWVRLQVHRILTRLQNLLSRTACHSHDYFLFLFVVNFTTAAMRAHLHSVDRCVSQQRQRQHTGLNHRCIDQSDAWSQICSWYCSLPATVYKTPRCESVPTCMISWKTWDCFGWAQSLLCLFYSQ